MWEGRAVLGQIFQRLFGLLLIVFVGMYLYGWQPPAVSTEAQPLWDAIINSGYIMPAVIITYGICGLAFLSNRFAPLAAILLVPVSLNIFLYHSFLNPSSIPFAITFFGGNMALLYVHRKSYKNLLVPGSRHQSSNEPNA
jgi:hypothetical protein